MSHPSRIKGARFEALVAGYLACKRIGAVNGNSDKGDLEDPDWVIECKDEARIDLAGYMGEVEREVNNADHCRWGVAIVKRRRASVSDAYAVMPLWQWRAVRDYIRHLEAGGTSSAGMAVFVGNEVK